MSRNKILKILRTITFQMYVCTYYMYAINIKIVQNIILEILFDKSLYLPKEFRGRSAKQGLN